MGERIGDSDVPGSVALYDIQHTDAVRFVRFCGDGETTLCPFKSMLFAREMRVFSGMKGCKAGERHDDAFTSCAGLNNDFLTLGELRVKFDGRRLCE